MLVYSSKLDLLVRVRYSNPLPAPPCPPKLLQIPTNPNRYARPEFLGEIANDTPLPMIVDAECGMPLDLGRWECLWEEGGDDSGALVLTASSVCEFWLSCEPALNPDPQKLPILDPRDRMLLEDPSSSARAHVNGGPSAPSLPQHVAWLRKTEYISRENTNKGGAQEPFVIPISRVLMDAEIWTENTLHRRSLTYRTVRNWLLSRPHLPLPTPLHSLPPAQLTQIRCSI